MFQLDQIYAYLKENYAPNEPIFLSELSVPGIESVCLRQQIKKLTEDGRLNRFDTGVYFLPQKSIFRSGSSISVDEVIRKKYLMNGAQNCGYLGGGFLDSQLGLTTQVPGFYEIYTNNATTDYRETQLANLKVILRKPYCTVNDQNALILQLLSLLKEVMDISEVEGKELTERLVNYLRKKASVLRP